MYDIKNCKICGKVYQSMNSSDICPNCQAKDNETFDRIKSYINSHPGAKIFDVVVVLDIPLSIIRHYLKEYRLEIIEKENSFLNCEICGHSIHSGRYCDECSKKASHGTFKSACTENPTPKSDKVGYFQYKFNNKTSRRILCP